MYNIILAFLNAFVITYLLIPSIVQVAKTKRLYDEPGERRSHTVPTPSLGGIAIFAGLSFAIVMWTPFNLFGRLQYILCAFLVIFLIGAKDDIDPVSPRVKLAAQILAAGILIYASKVKITSFYGVFGINDLPEWISVAFTVFIIIVIINAFNLIDGINGLSGSLVVLIFSVFGTWFYLAGRPELSVVAFSTVGAVVAFLKYNITPADIFMGDTGSLLLGLICSILAIEFIEFHRSPQLQPAYAFQAVPAVAIGIIIIPLFDTLRVFTTRMLKGRSPFQPDRTHIHHLLLDSGLTHTQATSTLVLVNIIFIFIVFFFQYIGTLPLILLILLLASVSSALLYYSVRRKKSE